MHRTSETTERTSASHPLQIAEVRAGPGMGCIGVTFCPGKKQRGALTGSWNRDLHADLDMIASWGASAVITLIEDHEFEALGVADLGDEVRNRHMDWFHLPIADYGIPDAKFEEHWEDVGHRIRLLLARGFDIVVHCKGGLGRAGMIAARLLVEFGEEPTIAIAKVREVRPGAIETAEQERYVARQSVAPLGGSCSSGSEKSDRAIGTLVGLATGDAVGTTLEFSPRDSYPPLRDMVGQGPFKLEAGQWTDDTAMALALADSIIEWGEVNERDLMAKFASWRDEGDYSCTGACFDIGVTTSSAISRWKRDGNAVAGSVDPMSAGNGSLMRLAPVAIAFANEREALRQAAARQSRTTHAATASVNACEVYAELLSDLINGLDLDAGLEKLRERAWEIKSPEIAAIAKGSWRGKRRVDIRSSGYVVHSLEAAIWSVARSASFEDAVLTAANLGDDADTTAAIAGQLAGALYGASNIPQKWLEKLAWRDRIIRTALQLDAISSSKTY